MKCCTPKKPACCGIGYKSIPAALGDDTGPFKPENGAYHNMLIRYEENGALYLYTNDGIFTQLDGERFFLMIEKWEHDTSEELEAEIDQRFSDLNVQSEIDHKLNEMVADGTLAEIIDAYLQTNVAWTFDTVADMKAAENLVAGAYAQTLGYNSVGDGGGAIYLITDTLTDDCVTLDSGLYAKLMPASFYNSNMFNLYGITVETHRHSNGTKYYITHIPYTNSLGLRNELVQGFPNDDYGDTDGETVRNFVNRHNSPFGMNIGLWDTTTHVPFAPIIQNGNVETPSYSNAFSPIGIDEDGMVTVYPNGTTGAEMVANGVVYGCCAYDELIHDNVVVYDTTAAAWTTTLYQHQIFAQLSNGDYVILTCDGKNYEDRDLGLTYEMLANILMAKYDNIRTAYACDGGGSVSTVVNHEFINVPSDDNFATERAVGVIWYIKPVNSLDNFLSLYTKIGNIEAQVKQLKSNVEYAKIIYGNNGILISSNDVKERINAIDGKFRVTNVTTGKDVVYYDMGTAHPNEYLIGDDRVYSLFKIMKKPSDYSITDADNINFPSMLFADGSTLTNVPDPTIAHIVMTFPILSNANLLQIAIPYNTNTDYKIQYRYKASGTWRAWRLGQ